MMARVAFHEELEQLEEQLQLEGRLVLEMLGLARRALHDRDRDLAEKIIEFDERVDDLYVQVEHGIESLLARQTPVASDLRLVLAMLHVNLHLERMADYCVTIAKMVRLSSELESDDDLTAAFEEMAEQATAMLTIAMDAFSGRDDATSEQLLEMDDLINRHNRRVVGRVLDLGPDHREWACA